MRVLILPDADFLGRERAMLGRLEIGLADEGVRVVHAMPASVEGIEAAGVYSTTITYVDTGIPFTLPLRVSAVVRSLRAALPEEDVPVERLVDAVYATGERAWPMAVELGRRLDASVLLDVWKSALAPAARTMQAKASARSVLRGLALRYLAPDNASAALLRRDLPSPLVPIVPWGVHPGAQIRARLGEGGSLTVALLATGMDGLAVRAAIEALSRVAAQVPGLMVFVDAHAAEKMPIWTWAKSVAMAERLSVISELEGRRDLLMQADILLVPEAAGEHRSIVLDALASCVLVVAARDPLVEWLSDDRYAVLVDRAEATVLAQAILALLREPARVDALRTAGWAEIHDRRQGSAQVRALLSVVDSLVTTPTSGGGPGGVGGQGA